MAAYAAVNSLKNTIQYIQDPEVMELLNKELKQLEEILKRLDSTSKSKSRKTVNDLDEQIKEAVWKVEDLLELRLSDKIASLQSKSRNSLLSEEEEEEEEKESDLQHKVDSFIKTVRDMKKKYMHELDNLPEDEDDDESAAVSSLRIDSNVKRTEMVGLSDLFICAKWDLLLYKLGKMCAVSLIGMAGIGKTTLAEKLFQDPSIRSHFECRVWVTVGRKYQFNKILECILAQVLNPYDMDTSEGDDEIMALLKERLKVKRCLIVLDDVWEKHVLDDVIRIGNFQILLTARKTYQQLSNQIRE